MPFTSYEDFDAYSKKLSEAQQAYKDYEDYLKSIEDERERERQRRRKIIEDPEYAKLYSERYRVGQENLKDTPSRVAAHLEQGIKSTGESLYKQYTEAYEASAYLLGADYERLKELREERKAAEQMMEEQKAERLKGIRGGSGSEFAYEAGQAAAQEAPFLAASAGTGRIVSGTVKKGLEKSAAKKAVAVEAALKEAPVSAAGRASAMEAQRVSAAERIAKLTEKTNRQASVATMGAIHGDRKFSSSSAANYDIMYPQVYSALEAQNRDGEFSPKELARMADEQTREIAIAPSLAAGAATTALVTTFGATGVESLFANTASRITARNAISTLGKGFGFEFTEEGADQFIEQVIQKHTLREDRPWEDIISETWHAATIGGVVGVKYSGIGLVARAPKEVDLRWRERQGRKALERIQSRDFFISYIKEQNPELSDEVVREKARELADGVADIKERARLRSSGATEEEIEDQSAINQLISEDQLDQLESEGVDVSDERTKNVELKVFYDRGVTAAQTNENAEDIIEEIERDYGAVAATKFAEGFNQTKATDELSEPEVGEEQAEPETVPAEEPTGPDIEAPVDVDVEEEKPEVPLEGEEKLEALAKEYWEAGEAESFKSARPIIKEFDELAEELGYDHMDRIVEEDSVLAEIFYKHAPEHQKPALEEAEKGAAPAPEPAPEPVAEPEPAPEPAPEPEPTEAEAETAEAPGTERTDLTGVKEGDIINLFDPRGRPVPREVTAINADSTTVTTKEPGNPDDPGSSISDEGIYSTISTKSEDFEIGTIEGSPPVSSLTDEELQHALGRQQEIIDSKKKHGQPYEWVARNYNAIKYEQRRRAEEPETEIGIESQLSESPSDEAFFGPPDLRQPGQPTPPAEEKPLPVNMIPYTESKYNSKTQTFDKVKGESEYVSLNGRFIKLVDVNGIKVPFYLSTGRAGKENVPEGKWYPIFGVSTATGWLNKGTQSQILDYYGSPALRDAAKKLDDEVGDIRAADVPRLASGMTKRKGKKGWSDPSTLEAIEFINNALGVTALKRDEALKKDDDGVKGIDKNIRTVLSAIEGESSPTESKGQVVFNALAAAGDLINPELVGRGTLEGEALSLGSMLEGRDETEPPPGFSYDRNFNLVPLKPGEKREPVRIEVKRENLKIPPNNLLIIGSHIKRTTGRGRGGVEYHKSIDGFLPSGHKAEEVLLPFRFAGENRPMAFIRYNKEGGKIQVGYFVRSAGPSPFRFKPTHTLKNSERYEYRTPNGTLKGFKIPTSLTTSKAIVNEKNWERLPSKYSGKLERAEAAATPDSHLIRRFIDHISSPVLKRQLNLMWNNGLDRWKNPQGSIDEGVIPPMLSLEGIAATILVANQFKKGTGSKRGKYARTLISTGKMEELANSFESAIKTLRNSDSYTKTVLNDKGTPKKTVNALLRRHDLLLRATKGLSPGQTQELISKWEEEQVKSTAEFDVKQFLNAMEMVAAINKTHKARELTLNDIIFVDKGQADEYFTGAVFTPDQRGQSRAYQVAIGKAPPRVKKIEDVTAEVVSDREVKTTTVDEDGALKDEGYARAYGIEITDSNRIPLSVLVKGLKELMPDIDFSTQELPDGTGRGTEKTEVERIKFDVDPTQKKKTGTSFMDVTGGKGGAKTTTARAKRAIPGRVIKRTQLNLTPLNPEALTEEKLLTVRAAIKFISKKASRIKDFQPSARWTAANKKKLKLERLKAKKDFNDKLKKFWNASEDELADLAKKEETQFFKDIARWLLQPNSKKGTTWAQFIKNNSTTDAVGGIKRGPDLTKAEKAYLSRGLTIKETKLLQEEGGSEADWAGMLTAGKIQSYASDQLAGVLKEGEEKPEATQGFLPLTTPDAGPPDIVTEEIHLVKDQLKDRVKKFRLDGRQFYIIDTTGKEDLGFWYTFNAKEATKEEFGGYGTGEDWVQLPMSEVKTELQAKNRILDQVNKSNDNLSVLGMAALIDSSLASKAQEIQQAVPIEKYEAGEAEYAYTRYSTAEHLTQEQLVTREIEPEHPDDAGVINKKLKAESEAVRLSREKAFKEMARLTPVDRRKMLKHTEAVSFKWQDKPQERIPMPEPSQKVHRQKEDDAGPRRIYEINNAGRLVNIPKSNLFNNAWRKRNGLKLVEFSDGKWWHVIGGPVVHTKMSGPRVTTAASEEVLDRMAATAPVTHGERMRQTRLNQPPPSSVVDPGRDFEGNTFTLTEEGGKKVQSILNTYTNTREFLEEMADRIADYGKGELAHQLTKFAEAGRPGQPSIHFKDRIKNPAGRDALKSWAKRVSPEKWQAVAHYAEEILLTANTGGRANRFRVRVEQAERIGPVIPTDLPWAQGKKQLKDLISRKDNGLTDEAREKALRIINEIDSELLDNLSLRIGARLNSNGDTEVDIVGEFNTLGNLITLAGDVSVDPDVLLEEIAHFTARVLPEKLRNEARGLHKAALDDAFKKSQATPVMAKHPRTEEKIIQVRRWAAKHVLVRKVLEKIRKGEDGQLTSDEYRAVLPRIGDLVSGTGKMSDTVSVDAEMLEDIVRETYHLANPDEFYANAMVTRVGDSTFDRARGFLKNILRAITRVFSGKSESEKVDDFVRRALKALANPDKRNKDMRGMLMRRNILAKGMRVLSRADRLRDAVLALNERAQAADDLGNTETAARRRDEVKRLVSQASAITNIFDKVIRRIAPDLSPNSKVWGMVNMRDIDFVNDLLEVFPSESEYRKVLEKFASDGRHELGQATALYAMHMIQEMERVARTLTERAEKRSKDVRGKNFLKSLTEFAKKVGDSAVTGKTKADLTSEIKDVISIAATEFAETGDIRGLLGGEFVRVASEDAIQAAQDKAGMIAANMEQIATILTETADGRELLNRDDISEEATEEESLSITGEQLETIAHDIYQIVDSVLAANQTPIDMMPDDEQIAWRVAAGLFAGNKKAREHATVSSFGEEDAEIYKRAVEEVAKLRDGLESGKLNSQSAFDSFSGDMDLLLEEGKLAYVARYAIRSPMRRIKDALDHRKAADLARAVMNDPEMLDYRRQVGIDAKVDDVPDLLGDTFYEQFVNGEVIIPVPPTDLVEEFDPDGRLKRGKEPNVRKFRFFTGKEEGAKENLLAAYEAAIDIQKWLDQELKKTTPVIDAETGLPMLDEKGDVIMDDAPLSPYWNFYWNTLQQLQAGFLHDAVWNAPDDMNQRGMFRNTYFGVLRHLVSGTPTRAMKIASRYVDKHEMYYVLFDSWKANFKAPWANKLLDAAKSRPGRFALDVGGIGLRWEELKAWAQVSKDAQVAKGVANWERTIGRHLRESWQEGGQEIGVGELLPNGEIVTKEDMALIDFEFKMANEAYEINELITDIDESVQPLRVNDQTVKTLRRRALKRGKKMLPRRFSTNGRSLVSRWNRLKDDLKGADLFDAVFRNGEEGFEAMVSFLNDRDPEWITAPTEDEEGRLKPRPGSPNEHLYSIVAQEIQQNGPEMEHTTNAVIKLLAEKGSRGADDVKVAIMNELEGSLTNLNRRINPPEKDAMLVQLNHSSGHSPMTDARQDKLGPSFFYTHGFNHEAEVQSFTSSLQLPVANGVINALRSASRDLNDFINKGGIKEAIDDAVEKLYGNKKNPNKYRYSNKVLKEVRKELGIDTGSKNNPEVDIFNTIVAIDSFTRDYEDVYGAGYKDFTVDLMPKLGRRVWSSIVGGILGNTMTAMRNVSETAIGATINVQSLTGGTGLQAAMAVITRGYLVHALKLGGSLAKSLLKLSVYPVGGFKQDKFVPLLPLRSAVTSGWWHQKYRKGLKQKLMGIKPDITMLIQGLFDPMIVELAQVMPRRINEHKILERQGLGMPITPTETMLNFGQLREMGGRIMDEVSAEATSSSNPVAALWNRGLYNLVGHWESYIALWFRPTLPRIGDLAANNIMASMGHYVGHNLERKARLAFGSRMKNKVALDEDITPQELVGNFLGLLEANRVTWNNVEEFLSQAGVTNFKDQVRKFWRELQTAPNDEARRNVKLFKPKQLDRMAAIIVMTNNHPTPANRPLWMKTNVMNSVLFALTGWSFNQLQNWAKSMPGTGYKTRGDKSVMQGFVQRAQAFLVMAAALGIAIPDNWLLEYLARMADRQLYGRRRVARLPNEMQGTKNQMWATAGLAFQSVPLFGGTLAALAHDLPGRPQHLPANLLMSQVGNAIRWGMEMKEAGLYLPDTKNREVVLEWMINQSVNAANRALPMTRIITSRISPHQKALLKTINAIRAVKANYGDPKATKSTAGWSGQYQYRQSSLWSPYRELWAAAVESGDLNEASRIFDEAIPVFIAAKKYATGDKVWDSPGAWDKAKRSMEQSLKTMNPIRRSLRSVPTRDMFWRNLTHVNKIDRNYIETSIRNWENAYAEFGWTGLFANEPVREKPPTVPPPSKRIPSYRPKSQGPRSRVPGG